MPLQAGTRERNQYGSFTVELEMGLSAITLGRIKSSVIAIQDVTGASLCSEDWMSRTSTLME